MKKSNDSRRLRLLSFAPRSSTVWLGAWSSLALGLALTVASKNAQAQLFIWEGGASSSWTEISNWLPGTGLPATEAPNSSNSTLIMLDSANPAVADNVNTAVNSLYIGSVDTNDGQLLLKNNSNFEVRTALYIGNFNLNSNAILTIQDSTLNAKTGVDIGHNGQGVVRISGADARLLVDSGSMDVMLGNYGWGELHVADGALVQSVSNSGMNIGNARGSGLMDIHGQGSRVLIENGDLTIGAKNAGASLTVRDGAGLKIGRQLDLIGVGGVENDVLVSGTNSWVDVKGDAYLGYGSLTRTQILDNAVFNVDGELVTGGRWGSGIGESLLLLDNNAKLTVGNGLYVGDDASASMTIARGAHVRSDGGVTLAYDAAATGVLAIGANAGQPAVAPGSLDTPNVVFGDGDGRLLFNHTDTSGNYTFSPVISGAGGVDVLSGSTSVSGLNTYSGATTLYGGRLAASGSNVLSPRSDYVLHADSTLDLMSHSQRIASLANAGHVDLSGIPGTQLTVTGAYTSNGGEIALATVLGGDDSSSSKLIADRVVLGSEATRLLVNNTGGLGAKTTGDGIQVVQVLDANNSAEDAFALGGRVAAGAYEYRLRQGGAQGNDGSWYLTSSLHESDTQEGGGDEQVDDYRIEVPLNMAISGLTNRYGRAMLGSYHDRTGGLGSAVPASGDQRSSWGRVFGSTGSVDARGNNASLKNGSLYDYDLAGMQIGQDVYRSQNSNGSRDSAGVYFGLGTAFGRVQAPQGGRAGTLSMDAYTLGAYWTHTGATDWYVDTVVQGTRYHNIKIRSADGPRSDTNAYGVAASVELGYPMALSDAWTLEPQMQVIYQHDAVGDTRDNFGPVDFRSADTLQGRLGARLSRSFDTSHSDSRIWARANVWQKAGRDTRTTFSNVQDQNPTAFNSKSNGTWTQIGLGASGQLSRSVSAFASADYEWSIDDRRDRGVAGRVGLKITW